MRALITTIARSLRGNPIPSTREVSAEEIRIGRGAECELRLADPRVPLHAQCIVMGASGPQIVDLQNQARAGSDERPQVLVAGENFRIGPYQIEVTQAPPGFDLALTCELTQPLPESAALISRAILVPARRLPFSRRWLSWTAFLAILGWFLILPTMDAGQAGKHGRAGSDVDVALRVLKAHATDASWNPGELSLGHQNLAGGCKACHSEPFVQVKNQDCLACHKNARDHVDPHVAQVAVLNGLRCAVCHVEHKGAMALAEQNHQYDMSACKDCHADIKAAMPSTMTLDASDFAHAHPEFRVSVATGPASADLKRVRLDASPAPAEPGNLKFPHDLHLRVQGVQSPQGIVKLDCASCHKLDETGLHFKPVTMEANCQSCHELRFEPADPARKLPHGDVGQVMAALRDYYGNAALNHIDLRAPSATQEARLPPGMPAAAAERIDTPRQAQLRADAVAHQLFEKTTCFICHQVTSKTGSDGRPDWHIAPIRESHAWMTTSLFRHDVHAMAACTTCHAAQASKSAQDVLMPGIRICRTCHAGAKAEPQKIVSNCNMCHAFHVTDHTMPANMPALAKEHE